MKRHWVCLQLRFEAPNVIASGGFKWQYIAIIATFSSLSFFFFIRPLISELAERNSTISGHMVGSSPKCDLKMHVRSVGYPFHLQIGSRKPTFFDDFTT